MSIQRCRITKNAVAHTSKNPKPGKNQIDAKRQPAKTRKGYIEGILSNEVKNADAWESFLLSSRSAHCAQAIRS